MSGSYFALLSHRLLIRQQLDFDVAAAGGKRGKTLVVSRWFIAVSHQLSVQAATCKALVTRTLAEPVAPRKEHGKTSGTLSSSHWQSQWYPAVLPGRFHRPPIPAGPPLLNAGRPELSACLDLIHACSGWVPNPET